MSMIMHARGWVAMSLIVLVSVLVPYGEAAGDEGDCGGTRLNILQENHVAWLANVDLWPDRIEAAAGQTYKAATAAWGPYVQSAMAAHEAHLDYVERRRTEILKEMGYTPESGELPPIVVYTFGMEDPENPGQVWLPGPFIEYANRDTLIAPPSDKDPETSPRHPASPGQSGPIPPMDFPYQDIVIRNPDPVPSSLDEAYEAAQTVVGTTVAPGATLTDQPLALLGSAEQHSGVIRAGGSWMPDLPGSLRSILVRAAYVRLLSNLAKEWDGHFRRNLSAFECLSYLDNQFGDLFKLGTKLNFKEGINALDDAIEAFAFAYEGRPFRIVHGDAHSTINFLSPYVAKLELIVEFFGLSKELTGRIEEASKKVEREGGTAVATDAFNLRSSMAQIHEGLPYRLTSLSDVLEDMRDGIAAYQDLRARESELDDDVREEEWSQIWAIFPPRFVGAYLTMNISKDFYFSGSGGLQNQVKKGSWFRAPITEAKDEHRAAVRENHEFLEAVCGAVEELELVSCR